MANSDMLVRVQADTKNYDANLAKASKTLKQFADNNLSMGGILKQSTGALTGMAASVLSVTAAIGAAKKVMGDMVRINMQFEQSSSNLAAVLGTSRDQITALTDQAKTLGATTQYTASQILELQANLARLGFNQNEILNSTKSVQAMATAMGADLGEAANLAGSALRGFGLNATEMERVASVLSVGTTKSALSFEKLATALPVVQTAAAKTGFTIEDTVAMLGKLTDNGINAASAATQLRKILNDSTTAGTKLANALGGPVKSFDELVVALDKAGKAGQNHADSVALVNSKNATALDILRDMAQQREVDVNGVKKQTSALQELRDSITDCSDGMKSMQDEQLNTLQGSITILNSAWEGLMLTFSESNGVIKSVVDSLTDLLGAYTKWRNRNAGGDAAIKTYELAEEDIRQKGEDRLKGMREATNGRTGQKLYGSDEDIKKKAEADNAALTKNRDAMRSLLTEWEKAGKLGWGSKEVEALIPKVKALYGDLKGYAYEWSEQMQKAVAQKNDAIAVNDYVIGALTPQTKTVDPNEEEKKKEDNIKILKAQYEEQEKAQIASLDRMAMNEADYEAQVYKIKRETLQKIADLYQDETAEKARANAAISQLDIQYQGIQMRLANRSNKGSAEPEEVYMGGREMTQIEKMRQQMAIQQADQAATLDDTTFKNLMGTVIQKGIDGLDLNFEVLFQKMFEGENIPDEAWQSLVDEINAKLEEMNLPPIKLDVKTGGVEEVKKDMSGLADNVQGAISAFGQLGGAIQQIEDPSAKVAGIIMGAVAEVAASFASSLKGNFGTWDWIAAAIAGTATMISTISAIKSVTSGGGYAGKFAEGGIVPGNNYNDGLVANLSSGELILNRSQQDSIASQLTNSNPFVNLQLTTKLSGTELLILLNNTNRSMGGSRSFYTERH